MGYGDDDLGAESQEIKKFMADSGVALISITVLSLISLGSSVK